MFLLAAMKFHCYVTAMPRGAAGDIGCALAAINGAIQHMFKLIRSKQEVAQSRYSFACQILVRKAEVQWLALTAFQRVLCRKQVHAPTPSSTTDQGLACMQLEFKFRSPFSLGQFVLSSEDAGVTAAGIVWESDGSSC